MAGPRVPKGFEQHKRKKKSKSRTQIEDLSSSSDSDNAVKQVTKLGQAEKSTALQAPASEKSSNPKPKSKKQKEMKAALPSTPKRSSDESLADEDISMADAPAPSTNSIPARQEEDFTSIYLRKITAELADDLNNVREANDFTNRSLPMLIHALKQGESIFSAEEKRRVVGAVNL